MIPLCDEKCGLVTDIMSLTMDEIRIINEYRLIQRDFETLCHEEMEKENESRMTSQRKGG